MKLLKLLPEWGQSPIEIRIDDKADVFLGSFLSCSPEELPLSQELISEIWAWADIYDTFLDWDDPGTPKDIDPAVKADFWAKGELLLKKIQLELGEGYSIKAGWNMEK